MRQDNGTIMVVEDEPSMRNLLVDTLQLNGTSAKNIRAFANGAEAQAYLQEADCRAGVVICDIAMPRLNGFELYESVYQQMPGLKFLFITALKMGNAEKGLVERAGLGFLEKPFSPEQLLAAIENLSDRE